MLDSSAANQISFVMLEMRQLRGHQIKQFNLFSTFSVYGECGDDVIYGRHNLIRHYMCFAVFYFIYDTYAMFVVYNESRSLKRSKRETEKVNGETPDSQGDKSVEVTSEDISKTIVQFIHARPLMIAHHMVLPLILFPIFMAFQTGLGDCLLAIGFLMEASTPFVSARKILSVVGKN